MKNKDLIPVSLHTPFAGNLPRTDLSISCYAINHNLDKLPACKYTKIFLSCRSCRMSTIAATEQVRLGYTNIWYLDDEMAAWKHAGLSFER